MNYVPSLYCHVDIIEKLSSSCRSGRHTFTSAEEIPGTMVMAGWKSFCYYLAQSLDINLTLSLYCSPIIYLRFLCHFNNN